MSVFPMRPITASAVGAEALPTPGRSVPGSAGGPESGGPPPALSFEVAGNSQAAIARLATSAASRRGLVLFMVFAPCRGSFTTLSSRLRDGSRSPSGRLPESDAGRAGGDLGEDDPDVVGGLAGCRDPVDVRLAERAGGADLADRAPGEVLVDDRGLTERRAEGGEALAVRRAAPAQLVEEPARPPGDAQVPGLVGIGSVAVRVAHRRRRPGQVARRVGGALLGVGRERLPRGGRGGREVDET